MELIERYLHELSRDLPKNLRDDVTTELRSSLEEGLEAAVADGADPEAFIGGQLRELGPPGTLAASYWSRPQHVVGPELYPAFVKTYGICIAVMGGLIVLVAVLGFSGGGFVDLVVSVGALAGDLVSTAVTILGWVVLVFWVIGLSSDPKVHRSGAWDPETLPKIEDPDRVNRAGVAIGVFFLFAFVVALNFFPEWFVAFVSHDGQTAVVPLLGPGIRDNLPLLNVGLVGSLVVLVAVLRRGRWRILFRWLDLGFDLVTAVAMVCMSQASGLLQPAADSLLTSGWPHAEAEEILATTMPLLETMLRFGLGVGAFAIVISSGLCAWRLLK